MLFHQSVAKEYIGGFKLIYYCKLNRNLFFRRIRTIYNNFTRFLVNIKETAVTPKVSLKKVSPTARLRVFPNLTVPEIT